MTDSSSTTSVTVEGKRTVVIGGTSGIGRAIANGFAADGADVVASSRTEESVVDVAEELREQGARTIEQTCDVTDKQSLVNLRDTVVAELGGVDVLIVSPGAVSRKTIADISDEEWETVIAVQLTGVHYACQTFVDAIDSGSIITISSMASELAIPNLPAYSAVKGGTDSYTRLAAKEFGPDVRVNAIRPGFISTPQTADAYREGGHRFEEVRRKTETGRMGTPDELVGAAIYLASDAASYTTGEILTVDSGFSNTAFDR